MTPELSHSRASSVTRAVDEASQFDIVNTDVLRTSFVDVGAVRYVLEPGERKSLTVPYGVKEATFGPGVVIE